MDTFRYLVSIRPHLVLAGVQLLVRPGTVPSRNAL